MKVWVNGFDCTGGLDSRAAFNPGKVDIAAVSDSLIGLNYMIYLFQYDSIHTKFKGIVKA